MDEADGPGPTQSGVREMFRPEAVAAHAAALTSREELEVPGRSTLRRRLALVLAAAALLAAGLLSVRVSTRCSMDVLARPGPGGAAIVEAPPGTECEAAGQGADAVLLVGGRRVEAKVDSVDEEGTRLVLTLSGAPRAEATAATLVVAAPRQSLARLILRGLSGG